MGPQFNVDAQDLYGFFHGLDYVGAIYDYQLVGGKIAMVPRYASGVWWSRWLDLNNFDTRNIIEDYETRRLPLDVLVTDMNWHKKNDWSGFTFDPALFPFPGDTFGYIHAKGVATTLNLHDASGVNNWDDKFSALASYLGLPPTATKVPFNIVNATVAYAVEDIVLGALMYGEDSPSIDFWWIGTRHNDAFMPSAIARVARNVQLKHTTHLAWCAQLADWQQGGSQGGMTGNKQNPTIWLAHLRCTDRHRIGELLQISPRSCVMHSCACETMRSPSGANVQVILCVALRSRVGVASVRTATRWDSLATSTT